MTRVNTTFNSTEEMINKLQEVKCKTKLKVYKIISSYYNEIKNTNFQTQEDLFARNALGISENYHEVLLLMKLLQTKPQVRKVNNNHYDLLYIAIKNRGDKEIVNDQYENIDNDYINFNDIVPDHYVGRKNDDVMLK